MSLFVKFNTKGTMALNLVEVITGIKRCIARAQCGIIWFNIVAIIVLLIFLPFCVQCGPQFSSLYNPPLPQMLNILFGFFLSLIIKFLYKPHIHVKYIRRLFSFSVSFYG